MSDRKVYLVDTENVGTRWFALLPNLKKDDKVLLFYTSLSPKFTFDEVRLMINHLDNVKFIECFNGYKNALDFQLCAVNGYLFHKDEDAAYVIVSDDCGYDGMISFMQGMGQNVTRLATKFGSDKDEKKKPQRVKVTGKKVANSAPESVPKSKIITDEMVAHALSMSVHHPTVEKVTETMIAVQNMKSSIRANSKYVEFNNRLQKRYHSAGSDYYKKLKNSGLLSYL